MSHHGHASSRIQTSPDLHTDDTPTHDFMRVLRSRTARRGEVRLALAVLEDAVRRLEAGRVLKRFIFGPLRTEAEVWIASRDRGSLFAFENVCGILGLDSVIVRGELLRPTRRRIHDWSRPVSPIPRARTVQHLVFSPSLRD